MNTADNPFSDLTLQRAIDLRWALRDIKAKRWKTMLRRRTPWSSPVSDLADVVQRLSRAPLFSRDVYFPCGRHPVCGI